MSTNAQEAAKNAIESAYNKTKEVLNSAAESTKGFANVAFENVTKILPGQHSTTTVPSDVNAPSDTDIHAPSKPTESA